MRNREKKPKKDYRKAKKYIKIILFISMLILIYLVSPRITQLIQEGAKYIHDLDKNIITRIVELILSVFLVGIVMYKKEK